MFTVMLLTKEQPPEYQNSRGKFKIEPFFLSLAYDEGTGEGRKNHGHGSDAQPKQEFGIAFLVLEFGSVLFGKVGVGGDGAEHMLKLM